MSLTLPWTGRCGRSPITAAVSTSTRATRRRRWESALLVNVDNETLSRLMANQAAMDALMKIEGFHSLNEDIQTIINKSEAVKKVKKEGAEKLTPKEKKELTEEEKEYKSARKRIQEKLIKFATRIPVFMYLTDYREHCLKDVITQLEPGLFKKVTGLDVKDFELLVSLGVFNDSLMNDAVYKFKRYEDASLSYTGINRHQGEERGGWDTVLSDREYNDMFAMQQASMAAPEGREDDLPPTPAVDFAEVEEKESATIAAGAPRPGTAAAPGNKAALPKASAPTLSWVKVGAPARQAASAPVIGKPVSKPQRPAMDLGKIKVGVTLRHKAFGLGTVKVLQGGYLTVDFGGTEKRFLFPAAVLEGYLSLQ